MKALHLKHLQHCSYIMNKLNSCTEEENEAVIQFKHVKLTHKHTKRVCQVGSEVTIIHKNEQNNKN